MASYNGSASVKFFAGGQRLAGRPAFCLSMEFINFVRKQYNQSMAGYTEIANLKLLYTLLVVKVAS
jgi:hypothetical protein